MHTAGDCLQMRQVPVHPIVPQYGPQLPTLCTDAARVNHLQTGVILQIP